MVTSFCFKTPAKYPEETIRNVVGKGVRIACKNVFHSSAGITPIFYKKIKKKYSEIYTML